MARTNPETRLQRRIQRALVREWPDAVFYKMHGSEFMETGIPDLIGCVRGRMVALEVKHPEQDHPVSAIQQAQMDRLEAAGAIVAVVEYVEEALAVVRAGLTQTA